MAPCFKGIAAQPMGSNLGKIAEPFVAGQIGIDHLLVSEFASRTG